MAFNKRALVALVIAAVVVVGTSGMAFAAAPTVDSETTDTTTTSELNDGNTITYNATTNTTLQADFDSANGSFKLIQDDGNYTLSTYENESDPSEITVTNASQDYLNLTLADDETGYSGIEADAGENVTLTYRLINDSTLDNPDRTNVTVYWDNDASKSFIRGEADDTETGEVSLTASIASSLPVVGSDNTTQPAKVEQDIGVNGSDQQEITVYVESTDAQDALTETYDSADGDSDVTYDGWVTVDGQFVPVLSSADNAPSWLQTDNETYATVTSDGSEVVIHNAGSSLDSSTSNATVQVVGNEEMSYMQIRGMVSEYGAGLLTQVTEMVGGEATSVRDQFEVAGA